MEHTLKTRLIAGVCVLLFWSNLHAAQVLLKTDAGPGQTRSINTELGVQNTMNTELYGKTTTLEGNVNQGVNTTSNPVFNSLSTTSGNLSAAGVQVVKQWTSGLSYTVGNTAVVHGGVIYVCIASHLAAAETEPGVGAAASSAWATVTAGGGAATINDLTDVDTTGKATGKVLKFDASGNLVVGDDLQAEAGSGEENVQANWTEADTLSDAFILNKPTLGAAAELGATNGTIGDVAVWVDNGSGTASLPVDVANSPIADAGDYFTTDTIEAALQEVGVGSTDSQTLSFISPNLTISGGNSVDISTIQDGTGTDDQIASEVNITDSGDYYIGLTAEAALQEAGAAIATFSSGSGYVTTPTSSDTTCTVGQWSFDASYIYVCEATDQWDRYAITWDSWSNLSATLTASPTSWDPTDPTAGDTDPTTTITFTANDGDVTFGAGAATLVTGSQRFGITTDNCSSSTVSAAGTCTVVLSFDASTEGGPFSDTLRLTSDASDSPEDVTLGPTTVLAAATACTTDNDSLSYSYGTGTNTSFDDVVGTNFTGGLAGNFVAGTEITQVTVKMLDNSGSQTGSIVMGFYTDSSGKPGTLVAGTEVTTSLSSLGMTGTYGDHSIIYPSAVSLPSGVLYVVFSPSGGADVRFSQAYVSGGPSNIYESADSGATWTIGYNDELNVSLYGCTP